MADDTQDPIFNKIKNWYSESSNLRSNYDNRWQRNMKLKKGIPLEETSTMSKVRSKSKIYFRKVWAISWRLVASFYQAFLRDPDKFKVEGRDSFGDQLKAKLLQFMVKYREDKMMNDQSLFLKHVWGVMNMNDYGVCYGKLSWKFSKETGDDGPHYLIMPNEQVFPDLSAETPDQMRFVIFDSYLTRDDLEENGYENIVDAQPTSVPSNELRNTRYSGGKDPLQNTNGEQYPESGKYQDDNRDSLAGRRYIVREVFWREKGKTKFCVVNGDHPVFFRKPQDSPYGKKFPLIMGTCLTEAHKLVGEGFPEPLEGPQESYNQILNMRKDNVALAMNRPTIASRYGNIDMNALVNRSAGKVVLADDINQVKEMEVNDVTQSAYLEASADDGMMQDMSGVNASIEGLSKADTATTSQINLSQGSAKIELYLAIGGETYFRSFYSTLAYFIQRFETKETVFRVANDQLQKEFGGLPYIDKIDDFEADITISVGMAYAGRESEIRQSLLVLDRGAIYNQGILALMQVGATPPDGFQFFDGSQIFKDLLPKMGKKDITKYFVTLPPPPPQMMQPQGGGGNGGMQGKAAPNIGEQANIIPQNNFQQGSLGGY